MLITIQYFKARIKKKGDVDTGILFDNMMEFLMTEVVRNDNPYNIKIQKGQNIDAAQNFLSDSKPKKQKFKKKNKLLIK